MAFLARSLPLPDVVAQHDLDRTIPVSDRRHLPGKEENLIKRFRDVRLVRHDAPPLFVVRDRCLPYWEKISRPGFQVGEVPVECPKVTSIVLP